MSCPTKKILFTIVLSIMSAMTFSQHLYYSYGDGLFEGRFGVTAGGTNYVTDTNMVFSKSQPGFAVGAIGTAAFSNKFELMVEINYSRNYATFIGREQPTSVPEDIKFSMDNINIPFILHYRFLNIKDAWHFAASTGPSVTFFHNYRLEDDSKSDYYLDPLYVQAKYMEFDTTTDKLSIDAFLSFGLSAEYSNFMLRGQYFMGITDPYRNAPVVSPAADITGKDYYLSFTAVYFFGDPE